MLIRDPAKRSTLEDIAHDPWLQEGSNVDMAELMPLVSRQHLTEEDHAHIIHKMVSGNIASMEEILELVARFLHLFILIYWIWVLSFKKVLINYCYIFFSICFTSIIFLCNNVFFLPVFSALDKNEYNHITATYFLLAERKLRAHRQQQADLAKNTATSPVMTIR